MLSQGFWQRNTPQLSSTQLILAIPALTSITILGSYLLRKVQKVL
ncbi:hypothetical protein Pint_16102 [Pistacia integerrima]|uniref:Uncharacterized protein n=1 Tax=Pistacia integerrima TaxID=434235 RepID=A0ACC0ZAS5_9ROSI|nr:hypothetical protein Pint_16102 [Pistacia integerrima]